MQPTQSDWRSVVPSALADQLSLWEPCYGVFDQWERACLTDSLRPAFAFLAAARVRRGDPSHLDEALELCPPFSARPELTPLFMAGVPPFAIDRYGAGDEAGVCLFTPVLADMANDLPPQVALDTFEAVMRTTLGFARDLGARVAGLAGTLPALTDFGRSVRTDGIATTTGHAGTSAVIVDLVDRLVERGDVAQGRRPWGLVGCGSIGSAVARTMAARHPGWPSVLADARPDRQARTVTDLQAVGVDATPVDTASVLEACDVVISAVTTPIDLDRQGVGHLRGTVVIDDSQPACFDREALHARDARLYWPLAQDESSTGLATRTGLDGRPPFTYGGRRVGVSSPTTLFGCEAEVAALGTSGRLDLALQRPVQAGDVSAMQTLFADVGIRSAPPEVCER